MPGSLSSFWPVVLKRFCTLSLTIFVLLAFFRQASAASLTISLQAPASLLDNSVSRSAIDDTLSLLRRSFPDAVVTLNSPRALIRLLLPDVTSSPATSVPVPSVRPYFCTAVPDQSFFWRSAGSGNRVVLKLEALNPDGVAAGLYALLQEKLGLKFYHPRESIIPVSHAWPLPDRFSFSGKPLFEKRGFHLHTLHPIELTDQLHDPSIPGAFEDVKAYLDWLARNGQNTFQFFLLRGVDRKTWPIHARRIVEYAHRRGIRCGVEISLAMLQQQAFQAITLLRPYPSYKKQVDASLSWLFQTPWDYLSLEVTMGEHLPILDSQFPELQMHIEQQVSKRYGARLLYATHVICSESGEKVRRPRLPNSGIMIHTVMCYSASETKAPVYGNSNQRFMLDAAITENKQRETWYWPESSYWVGFDSSVPLLLLPYLDVRWNDIGTMSRIGVSGHLTFTSGWEWGYWLVDWSIARWSWEFAYNGRVQATSALTRLAELVPDKELRLLWQTALELQNRYLKEMELLRYMSALTPFSELPPPFNKPFQPEPEFKYSWLMNSANQNEENFYLKHSHANLEQYAARMSEIVSRLDLRLKYIERKQIINMSGIRLAEELTRSLKVTAMRARHRAITMRAIIAKRGEHAGQLPHSHASEPLLEKARLVRMETMKIVTLQEKMYRYPAESIGRRHASMTAYPFGYLYPVSCLFFWEREEKQVRQERFDAFFMNLWNVRRTLGLESLFIK